MSEKEKDAGIAMMAAIANIPENKRDRVLGYIEGINAAQQLHDEKEEKKNGTP